MVIFIVPVYNDAENVLTLFSSIDEAMRNERSSYKVIMINDGSTDDTLKVAESLKHKLPIEIYSHYPNKGVGEAFRVGFHKSLETCRDGDVIVTLEADNTSDLGILRQLISQVNNGYDLVLASCYAKEGGIIGVTPFRLILSKGANMLLKFFFPIRGINTYTSFYRAFSHKALKEMREIYGDALIEGPGFECMPELLIKFSRNGKLRIAEVPMVLDVSKRAGKSKMRVLRTIKGILKVIVKEEIIKREKQKFAVGTNKR